MRTSPRIIAVAAAFALVLAGCAGDDTDEPATDEPTAEPDDEAAEDEPVDAEATEDATDDDAADDEAADGAASVAVDATDLGDVLVDTEGMALYIFDVDEQGPSQCYDDCEANWPPLLTDGDPVAEAGADEALLGTADRDDGSVQVTYDGWPLYYFIGDQAAGDIAGQGVNDVWWVVDASGAPVREAGEEEEDEDAGGRADY